MSCIKDIALREPLVDNVDSRFINTTSCVFKEVDIMTVKKEDLIFTAPFEIKAKRNDYVHAFIAWFDIWFNASHKPVYFTTSPYGKYTHWKQTVFYTRQTLNVSTDDVIRGSISCKPNLRNPRDLDITISYEFQGQNDSGTDTIKYKMC
ncbi:Nuclear SAM-dependent mono-and asymmetric methyltransferase [Spiromyces aspiralis]|uniref:Nuclear SAM-dependent mono-and asymmetric methyltransferase n=1 Tax=Spiromyces aspiralis TaxID=68401 RepID=A0ACC1HN05_9FUNG|nr:Nuclear SAM-dependent mono-and asymmetric methyltransferase [Spiromyces aspiralis]